MSHPDRHVKGYENVVVQGIVIKMDDVEYMKEVFYSPSEKKTYVGKLPDWVRVAKSFKP